MFFKLLQGCRAGSILTRLIPAPALTQKRPTITVYLISCINSIRSYFFTDFYNEPEPAIFFFNAAPAIFFINTSPPIPSKMGSSYQLRLLKPWIIMKIRDLVKFVKSTLVSRDCVSFHKYIKSLLYPGNQGTHDKLNPIQN